MEGWRLFSASQPRNDQENNFLLPDDIACLRSFLLKLIIKLLFCETTNVEPPILNSDKWFSSWILMHFVVSLRCRQRSCTRAQANFSHDKAPSAAKKRWRDTRVTLVCEGRRNLHWNGTSQAIGWVMADRLCLLHDEAPAFSRTCSIPSFKHGCPDDYAESILPSHRGFSFDRNFLNKVSHYLWLQHGNLRLMLDQEDRYRDFDSARQSRRRIWLKQRIPVFG